MGWGRAEGGWGGGGGGVAISLSSGMFDQKKGYLRIEC